MSMFSPDQLGKFIFNQGVYALCKDNYLQASEKFQEAYKINKHNVFLLIYMGIILTMRKNFYAAEKYFAEATKRDPNYDEAWFYSGENLFQAGNFNSAYECFEKTRLLNPAFNNINLRLKETKEAILRKRRGNKKDSLLRRFVKYLREAFEK
jgi:tetratricopeptide (TPR) repeat protein